LTRLGQEIARNPKSPENYAQRAVLMSRLGKWRESADDQLRQVELQPGDRYAWLRAAPLSILAGDTQRYQELCRKSVAQFRGAKQPDVADVVCKICLLRPGSVDMAELPVKALRDGCQAAEFQGFRPWFTACSALIAYREGNSQLAKELTKEAGNAPIGQPQALALTVRSMAEHRLGETGQARKTLAQATAVIPDELRTLGASSYAGPIPVPAEKVSHDWLIPEILRREAAALINGSQAQH
jgi:tetratricopeptide (TPR) repeat protein